MKYLFLGDSITSCGRFDSADNLGFGYVKRISRALGGCEANTIYNRGIDGFTLHRLCGLWQSQCPPLLPLDHISVLVGVNDLALLADCGLSETRQARYLEDFAREYADLLISLTGSGASGFCLMEPFLFPCPQYRLTWFPLLTRLQKIVRDTAEGFCLPFLPLHDRLNDAAREKGMDAVTTDGVHLTDEGHRIIARAWLGLNHPGL